MRLKILHCAGCILLATVVPADATATPTSPAETATAATRIGAPGEFEPQEYIWLSWRDEGFLGQAPFADVAVDVMKEITPFVKVRLMYSDEQPPSVLKRRLPRAQAEQVVRAKLMAKGIDLSRVELFFHPQPYGAIQDPGPFFLRTGTGGLALADYRFDVHPDPRTEAMDRVIATGLGMPTVASKLISEGGARQSNGRGTLLLVEAVERARNPKLTLAQIEAEHARVHGTPNVIWLDKGPADEEWGRLKDGRWGIGTGGHVDVFARFADASTILLAQVSETQRRSYPIMAETYRRMEKNYAILRAARDQDGKPFRILRVPMPDPMTASVDYDSISPYERMFFDGAAPGERIVYYLPAGYLNFIIANGVVVTARLWEKGRPIKLRKTDELARRALARAFPGRKIAQVGVRPLIHDGGGLHCHSRNQPFASATAGYELLR